MLEHQRVRDLMVVERAIVGWSDTADAALARMNGLGCDQLSVIDSHGVIGLCERSTLLACQQQGTWLGSIAVADLMQRGPFWCHEDDSPPEVLERMQQLGMDSLTVLDRDGHIVGKIGREQLSIRGRGQRTGSPVLPASV